jgi:hypothetical protein
LRRAVDPETWKIDWRQTGERRDRPRLRMASQSALGMLWLT